MLFDFFVKHNSESSQVLVTSTRTINQRQKIENVIFESRLHELSNE